MKLISAVAWLAALASRRPPRRAEPDPAEMGTAFGLDSITLVDPLAPSESSLGSETPGSWEQQAARRSRL